MISTTRHIHGRKSTASSCVSQSNENEETSKTRESDLAIALASVERGGIIWKNAMRKLDNWIITVCIHRTRVCGAFWNMVRKMWAPQFASAANISDKCKEKYRDEKFSEYYHNVALKDVIVKNKIYERKFDAKTLQLLHRDDSRRGE